MWLARYFFFRAEDGIRFWSVTGVQTCALPICRNVCHFSFTRATIRANEMIATPICGPFLTRKSPFLRSEERRVGKECRYRWSPYPYKQRTRTDNFAPHSHQLASSSKTDTMDA